MDVETFENFQWSELDRVLIVGDRHGQTRHDSNRSQDHVFWQELAKNKIQGKYSSSIIDNRNITKIDTFSLVCE